MGRKLWLARELPGLLLRGIFNESSRTTHRWAVSLIIECSSTYFSYWTFSCLAVYLLNEFFSKISGNFFFTFFRANSRLPRYSKLGWGQQLLKEWDLEHQQQIQKSANSFSSNSFSSYMLTSVSVENRPTGRCDSATSRIAEPWRMSWTTWHTVRLANLAKVSGEVIM